MNDEKNKNAKLTPTQVDRIWQHRLHNDIMFTNHNNFFLLCESILIAVISTISSNPQAKKPILLSVTILGFLLTVIWIYVQGKQRYILNLLKKKCRDIIPEYDKYKKDRGKRMWRISNMWLLAYAVPILIGLLWLYLFFQFI